MSKKVPPEQPLPPAIPKRNPGVVVPPAVSAEGLEVIDGSQPWLHELPKKPAGVKYGMHYKRFRFGPGQDAYHETDLELLDAIELWGHKIQYVYLPDHDYGVPLRSLNLYQPLRNSDFKRYVWKTFLSRGGLALLCAAVVGVLVYLLATEKLPFVVDPTVEPGEPTKYAMGALLFFFVGILGGVLPIIDAFIQWAFYPKRKPVHELKESLVHGAMFNSWIYRNAFRRSWPTWLLALIFVGVYLCQHLAPGSYMEVTERAMINNDHIRETGEWWRLFTGTLMHSNIFIAMHLCFNTLGIIVLGNFVQRMANPAMVPITFAVCAFGGAIGSITYLQLLSHILAETPPSLGASGGVLGLLGFLFVLVIARRKDLPYEFRILVFHNMIRISILGLLLIRFVDHGGHLGGFFSGVICGMVYELFHRGKWSVPWTPAKEVLTAVSFGVVLFGALCCVDVFFFNGQELVERLPKVPWP